MKKVPDHSRMIAIVTLIFLFSVLPTFCGIEDQKGEGGESRKEDIYLGNRWLRLVFSSTDYSLVGLVNVESGYDLISGSKGGTGKLWEIRFLNNSDEIRSVTGRDCRKKSHRYRQRGDRSVLEFLWEGISEKYSEGEFDVLVTVSLGEDQWYSEWTLEIRNRNSTGRLWRIHFPYIQRIGSGGKDSDELNLAVPYFTGWLFSGLDELPGGKLEWHYPSCRYTMQFCSFHRGEAGFYLASHDSTASHKLFTFEQGPKGEGLSYDAALNPEGMGYAGMDFTLPYPMIVGAFKGSWYEASKFYREWALKQKWCSRGPVSSRDDIPDWYKDISLWYKDRKTPGEIRGRVIDFQKSAGLPIAFHWYQWHQIPFDDDYPNYFPPEPGFAEAIVELQKNDVRVVPYVNGRLWDTDLPSWITGFKGAAKDRDMSNYIERYPSKEEFAPMCPNAEIWQSTLYQIVRKLVEEYHIDGVYLDQVSSAKPRFCFDRSHGHPPGGGSAWFDGYRHLLTRLNELDDELVLVTENNAEPLLDLMDGHLTYIPTMGRLIPLFQSVYSGYTTLFGRRITWKDLKDPVAFYVKQGDLFVNGGVPGWTEKEILDGKFRKQLRFLRSLAEKRRIAKKFLLEGELLKPLEPEGSLETISVVEREFERDWIIEVPVVRNSVWKAQDGTVGIVLVNTVEKTVPFRYRMDMRDYGCGGGDLFRVRLLDGRLDEGKMYERTVIERTETLQPFEIVILEVQCVRNPRKLD